MRISKIVICCLLFLSLPSSIWPQQKSDGSPKAFVQDFYNWYAPTAVRAANDNTGPASNIALRSRKHSFSPELFQALKDDSDAQAKASDLVGLDFDSFLGSQDPCEPYKVGNSTRKGNEYEVRVFSVCFGKKTAVPAVIAVLERNGRGWKFVNFLYPDQMEQFPNSASLLSNLKTLRDDRENSSDSKPNAKN